MQAIEFSSLKKGLGVPRRAHRMAASFLPDFSRWSPQELERAEAAAQEFLNSNIAQIALTFERRLQLLGRVTAKMKSGDLGFDERMLCLSTIEELSHGLKESAREFFEIGCQPSVAKMVSRAQ
jgi:hypothetical protein